MPKTNAWIEFVKKWAADHGLTYACAASDPKVRAAYLGSEVTVTEDHIQKATIKAKNIITEIKGYRRQQESIKKLLTNEEGRYDAKRLAKEQKAHDKLEVKIEKLKARYPALLEQVKSLKAGKAPPRKVAKKYVKRSKEEIEARREARQDKKDQIALEKLEKRKAREAAKRERDEAKEQAKIERALARAQAKAAKEAKPKVKATPKKAKVAPKAKATPKAKASKKEYKSEFVKYKVPKSVAEKAAKKKKAAYKSEFVRYNVPMSVAEKAATKRRVRETGYYFG